MIKVLHVMSDSNIGGAGIYVANYIKNCDRSNIKPTVLLPHDSAAVRFLENTDCKIIEADIAPDKSLDFNSIKVIREYIKEGRYDIVHAHGSASARLAAKGICTSVFTKHTLSGSGTGIKGVINKLMYRFTGGYAIAVSEAACDNLIELGFDRKRIFTVLNGVSDMGIATDTHIAECKKSFGIDANKFVIGCVARFSPEKDYKTLLDAAKLVLQKCDKVAFLLCGAGSTLNEMKSYAKSLGIYSNCVFAGMIFDPERAYHAMDAYCITSRFESFGQSLVEAWSAYLPAVTSDAPGFCEISLSGETSLVCPRGDSVKIAASILKLYNDPELCKTLAGNGHKRYLEKYSAKTFAENIESVYKTILKKSEV